MLLLPLLLLLALLFNGCAYVGEPLPPALNIPRPVAALTVEQVGEQVLVRFVLPVETTETMPLEIRGIEVRAEWSGGGEQVLAATRDREQPNIALATAPVKPWAGRSVALKARVQSRQGKWSEWSPVAPIQVEEPVATPAAVKAEAVAEGVRVSWRKAEGAAMRIEHRAASAKAFSEAAPAVAEDHWIDKQARFGEQQHYRLTAVASVSARSEPAEVSVLPVDTFAPAIPAGVAAVTGLGSIELNWDRPSDSDLAGFRIYRAQGASGGEFAKLNADLIAAATFSDRTVQAGAIYRYAVSSVDQNGNESARSQPVEITVPN